MTALAPCSGTLADAYLGPLRARQRTPVRLRMVAESPDNLSQQKRLVAASQCLIIALRTNGRNPALPDSLSRVEEVTSMIEPRIRLEDAPDVLTVEQMSEVLGIGRSAAYQVVRRGKLRTVRAGRLIKIPKTALAEALANGGEL